jgi:hypothetical protein
MVMLEWITHSSHKDPTHCDLILSLPPSYKFFDSAFHWLVGCIQLTEEEQSQAGIYLDRPNEEQLPLE